MGSVEPFDIWKAAARMQGDQDIAFAIDARRPLCSDDGVMTQFAQNPRPAICRHGVSKCGARCFRRYDEDLHDSSAQVRRPAQMSDRSGVQKLRYAGRIMAER